MLCLQNQPAELFQDFTTIEYAVPSPKPIQPPAYVFVVDTCVAEDELRACIASLSQALTTLPEYAQVRAVPPTQPALPCYRHMHAGVAWI